MNSKIPAAIIVSIFTVLALPAIAFAQYGQFDQVVENLEDTGIFEFFLPFILIFAVVYGMLQKTKIFGNPKDDVGVTKINTIVAFAFAAFIMIFPSTSNAVFTLTDYIGNFVGGALIYILGIIVFMVIAMMIGTAFNKGETPSFAKAGPVGGVVAFVLVIALFFSSGGTEIFPGIETGFNFTGFNLGLGVISPTIIALVIVLLIMGLAIYWITK